MLTAITTFFVTVLLVVLVLYLSKTTNGGGSGNSSNVISGIWYHDLDSVSDKKRVVVSIGQCTNEDGVYQPIEVDNNLYIL